MKIIFQNKSAAYGFDVVDKLEAGIVLLGWEVKSVKAGRFDVRGAYIDFVNGELLLKQARIPGWDTGDRIDPDTQVRARKLLVRKSQAAKIGSLASRPGYTLIPLEGYINDKGLVKIVIALVKGKKKYEKKQKIKERDLERQVRRQVKRY